jgi:hypothetical protein
MYLHENHEHANNFTFPRKLSEKIWQAGLRKNLYVFKFLPLLFIFVSQASFGIETQSVLQAQRDNEAIFINAAAKQLNKSPDVLTRTDYARIESISLPYPAILSIEPLTRFPNLKTLLLTSTYFTAETFAYRHESDRHKPSRKFEKSPVPLYRTDACEKYRTNWEIEEPAHTSSYGNKSN